MERLLSLALGTVVLAVALANGRHVWQLSRATGSHVSAYVSGLPQKPCLKRRRVQTTAAMSRCESQARRYFGIPE